MRYWKKRELSHSPKVGIAVATYLNDDLRRADALECLVASFRAQTYQNWRLLLVHDGSAQLGEKHILRKISEDSLGRISFIETLERQQQFGHPHRQMALDNLYKDCEWVGLTNDDNYYMPVYLEWLLSSALSVKKGGCDFVHCDCIHSHKLWKPMVTKPQYRSLDLGGFLVRATLAKKIPFDNFTFKGDGDWINRLARATRNRVQHVGATLFVHN